MYINKHERNQAPVRQEFTQRGTMRGTEGRYNVPPATLCTFTLTHKGLLLRMDKFEPHNFCQFSTEQSIDILNM